VLIFLWLLCHHSLQQCQITTKLKKKKNDIYCHNTFNTTNQLKSMPSEEKRKNNMPLLNLCHPKVPCQIQENSCFIFQYVKVTKKKGDNFTNTEILDHLKNCSWPTSLKATGSAEHLPIRRRISMARISDVAPGRFPLPLLPTETPKAISSVAAPAN